MTFHLKTGKIAENVYLIDTYQFGAPRVTTTFVYWDGSTCIFMDTGTSDNVQTVLRETHKGLNVPYEAMAGIILTHYHFDHGGGATKLWRRIHKKNRKFRIYVTKKTMNFLQNANEHLIGAHTTFGDFVGDMKPVPEDEKEEAYEIVKKDEIIEFKRELEKGFNISELSTPGHSPDHLSPIVWKNNKPIFMFAGEAAGTLFHGSKLISLPTSMPPNFTYSRYMDSLDKIIKTQADSIGFCHFGALSGRNPIDIYLDEHRSFMQNWRKRVIELFEQNPSTKFILENTKEEWFKRVDSYYMGSTMSKKIFENLHLALTYGLMVDLGFRKPKYEKKNV